MLRAEGPKIAGGALLLSRFFKQLFPRKGGSAPLSFKRRLQGRPVRNHIALLGLEPSFQLDPRVKPEGSNS
jgi:hypothetical protein